nr:hypothetical protein [Tanacetum cinerariifolium]
GSAAPAGSGAVHRRRTGRAGPAVGPRADLQQQPAGPVQLAGAPGL